GDWLCLALRTPQDQNIGMLFLFRPAGARPFQPGEIALLARLAAHLARALHPGQSEADDRDAQRQGWLIATPDGGPLWICRGSAAADREVQRHGLLLGALDVGASWVCPEAEALMPLAFGGRWRRSAELPAVVQALLQRLAPRPGVVPPPPHLVWCNAQGRFSL